MGICSSLIIASSNLHIILRALHYLSPLIGSYFNAWRCFSHTQLLQELYRNPSIDRSIFLDIILWVFFKQVCKLSLCVSLSITRSMWKNFQSPHLTPLEDRSIYSNSTFVKFLISYILCLKHQFRQKTTALRKRACLNFLDYPVENFQNSNWSGNSFIMVTYENFCPIHTFLYNFE